MRITEIEYRAGRPVEGYGPGFFRVDDQVIKGGICILPGKPPFLWHGWEDLEQILERASALDVLLCGMGADIAPVPGNAERALQDAEIGAEPMSSPSACRTYNILLSEGRRVALAALPVP